MNFIHFCTNFSKTNFYFQIAFQTKTFPTISEGPTHEQSVSFQTKPQSLGIFLARGFCMREKRIDIS
jgi:hypothetical protein